ncbi:MAG TPA: GrpB family protein [Hyphomonadaceae bacterium]|nr:GrpB family protein [Hyphomonadaceae bacterium]
MADFSADRIKVKLAAYDSVWASMAQEETTRLAAAIGDTLVSIAHVGSTAIPGIAAKPIIDLQPVVHSLAALDARRPHIEALGYQWRGEFGLVGRRYCTRDRDGARLFQAHCYEAGNPEIARTLVFRDYLRAHPAEAAAYEAVKREAAVAYPTDTLAYNDHKSAWILAARDRAEAWAARVK